MDIKLGIMPLLMVVVFAVTTLTNAQPQYVRPSEIPTGNYPPPNPTMNFGNRPTAPQKYPAPTPPQPYPKHPPPIQPVSNYPPPVQPYPPPPARQYPTPPAEQYPVRPAQQYHTPPAQQYLQPAAQQYQEAAAQPLVNYQPPPQQYAALGQFSAYNQFMSDGPQFPYAFPGGQRMNCTFMCKLRGQFEINPRCGYDGKTHRNECYLRCAATYEACDGTCPCYGSISQNGFLPPAPGVFPGKVPKAKRRGRRKECFCPFTNEVSCTDDGRTMSDCEAYCTYRSIKCERPCADPRCVAYRPSPRG